MTAARRLSPATRRWLFVFAAMALIARALVPAGWMPVAAAHGVTLVLCDGDRAMTPAPPHRMAMPMKPGAPMEHHHGAPDHPCAFAAAAVSFAVPAFIAPPLPSLVHRQPVAVPTMAAIGRGLAAPPPPPTGPPAFA